MDRRDFLLGATALPSLSIIPSLISGCADATLHDQSGSETAEALAELRQAIADHDRAFANNPEWFSGPGDEADPGTPNWLDTERRGSLVMFWRFMLAEEDIEPLRTQVVKVEDAARA